MEPSPPDLTGSSNTTLLLCDGAPPNVSTPPSTPPGLAPPGATGFCHELTRTAPSTPVSLVQQPRLVSNCVMGGGDSRAASEGSSPLRASSQRRTTAARHNAISLGSPVRLQQLRKGQYSGSRRPLVRAAPAPIPLWEYSPPRRQSHSNGGERGAVVLQRQVSELLFAPPGTPSPSATSGHSDSNSFLGSGGIEPAHDFPTTVALAVLAAIGDAVKEELGHSNSPMSAEESVDELVKAHPATPVGKAQPFQGANDPLPITSTSSRVEGGVQEAMPAAVPNLGSASPTLSSTTTHTTMDDGHTFNDSWDFEWLGGVDGSELDAPPAEPIPNSIVSLDPYLLSDIPHFNPQRPLPTNFDLLMQIGFLRDWPAVGVTKTELKRIIKTCRTCHRFMYVERRAQHHCDGPALDVRAPSFNFVQTMLEFREHSGFSLEDLVFLLFRCEDCLRIFSVTTEDGTLDLSTTEWTVHRCSQ